MTGMTYGGDAGGTYGGEPIDPQVGDELIGRGGSFGVDSPTPIDRTWIIGRSRVDAILGTAPDLTVGSNTTFKAHITSRGVDNHRARYEQLRDRILYSQQTVTTGQTYDGTPWFKERHPHETLVVKVVPGPDVGTSVSGVWGIIEGGGDETIFSDGWATIDVEIFVLARLKDYDTRHEVVDALAR